MAEPHRVVVTGMGAITPLGVGADVTFKGLSSGQSGVRKITTFDTTGMPVNYAGEVEEINPGAVLKRPTPDTRDRGLMMGWISAAEALRQAGVVDAEDRCTSEKPLGAVIGSGLGPLDELQYAYGCFWKTGWKAMRPTTVPRSMFNSYASQLSIYFGLKGMTHVVASACASGAAAIGQGYQFVKHGYADQLLVGGVDSALSHALFASWTNLRVLAKHEDPTKASRPFDRERRGLVLSESAAMLVLETEEHAKARGAEILGEILGFGYSSDAEHLTKPDVAGQAAAMQRCLQDARLNPIDVDYVNAHGTATKANDETEAEALSQVFGRRKQPLLVSSTKSMLGHAMGASSALEALVCLQSIRDQTVCPTINCDDPEFEDLGMDFVPHTARSCKLNVAISNSFGFGGGNFVLAIGGTR